MKKAKIDEEIEKNCRNCEKATILADGEFVLCPRKGVLKADTKSSCFRYDPLKRDPSHSKPVDNFEFVDI